MSKYIKEKHVYYVDFNPTKYGEFGSNHLVIVMKLNKGNETALVVPLTSNQISDRSFKIDIGIIDSLPSRLKTTNSYAVVDHSRNVSLSRFQNIIEGEAQVSDHQYNLLSKAYTDRALSLFNQTEQREYISDQFVNHVKKDILNFSYDMKKSLENQIQIDPSYIKLYSNKFRLLELISLKTLEEVNEDLVIKEIFEYIKCISDSQSTLSEHELENISVEENDDSV